jgi:hypothetical protein
MLARNFMSNKVLIFLIFVFKGALAEALQFAQEELAPLAEQNVCVEISCGVLICGVNAGAIS